MAMEIVEEAGNNEKPIEEGDMSCNSSFSSSAFKSSPAGIVDVNGSDDLLWNEIDLAERYLVSAMNEDAASTATTVLQTLSTLMHSPHSSGVFGEEVEEVGKSSEHEEMLECAGMVLLQSYRAIGRVGEFFDILEKLNVGVAEWPLILLETGACLQISDGAFPAAKAALEEFLAVQSTSLSEEKYAQVVELLVIKVLVKGLQEIESAMNWVERANLTEEARLVIMKKIQVQMDRIKASSEPVSVEVSSPTLEKVSFEEEKSPGIKDEIKEVVLEAGDDPAGTEDGDESSVGSKSLALLKRFKVSEGFFSLKTLLELALARLSAASLNLEGRALRFGALAALFLFVFLRHRHSFRRLVGKSFSAIRVGFSDLWKLAFSVQINPLAAVHPISAAY